MTKLTDSDYTIDNRDPSETWLHLPNGDIVVIDIVDLIRNTVENSAGYCAYLVVEYDEDLGSMNEYVQGLAAQTNGHTIYEARAITSERTDDV